MCSCMVLWRRSQNLEISNKYQNLNRALNKHDFSALTALCRWDLTWYCQHYRMWFLAPSIVTMLRQPSANCFDSFRIFPSDCYSRRSTQRYTCTSAADDFHKEFVQLSWWIEPVKTETFSWWNKCPKQNIWIKWTIPHAKIIHCLGMLEPYPWFESLPASISPVATISCAAHTASNNAPICKKQ